MLLLDSKRRPDSPSKDRAQPCRAKDRSCRLHYRRIGLVLVSLVTLGCTSESPDSSSAHVDVTLQPTPPRVGNTDVMLKLTDNDGNAVSGASVHVEGNMNHAGMTPSFAELQETEAGHYSGNLEFTMGGDWFLLISATTSDGEVLEHKVDVPGVLAK